MTDTVSAMRGATRFIAAVGVSTLAGSIVAATVLLAQDPTPLEIGAVTRFISNAMIMSLLPVAAGLLLFGLPVDWALRRTGFRRAAAYGAAGAVGGGLIGYAVAFLGGGYMWNQLAGTFALIGLDYGLVTALVFWLIFRRGSPPPAETPSAIEPKK